MQERDRAGGAQGGGGGQNKKVIVKVSFSGEKQRVVLIRCSQHFDLAACPVNSRSTGLPAVTHGNGM